MSISVGVNVVEGIFSVVSRPFFSTLLDSLSHPIASVQTDPDIFSPRPYCISLINEVVTLVEPRGVSRGCVLGVHAQADILTMLEKAKTELKRSKEGVV